MKKIYFILLAICLTAIACVKDEPKKEQTLKGTEWKLVGIVDIHTGEMRVLEPEDCNICYTLMFDTENSFFSYSSSNEMSGDYSADYTTNTILITNFGGTKRGERGDGSLWWSIIPAVKSFSWQNDELKLYATEYYLLFKPFEIIQ